MSKSIGKRAVDVVPVETWFTIRKLAGGWAVIKLTTQDDRVIAASKASEPDMKAIAVAKLLQALELESR